MKKLLAMTALSAALFFGQTAVSEEKAAEEVKPSDRKSARLNSSHNRESRMPSSA